MARTAWVAGATGLVGRELVKLLLEVPEYDKVVVLVRRPTYRSHPKLDERIVDYDRLVKEGAATSALALDLKQGQQEFAAESLPEVDDVFCCLGTTMKKAGSKEAFRTVDYEYPLAIARAGLRRGMQRFMLVSALGADAASSIYYNRTKGEIEAALRGLPIRQLLLFRPSLLLGPRKEFRFIERLVTFSSYVIQPLLVGPLRAYRAIEASQVAYAMYRFAVNSRDEGVRLITSEEMSMVER